ncbi:MAG TPA: cupredoxin domain-containing protein [Gaiellaceae bacterium]|nr:cupredoxin domain-containing protein [Gaiellaceae bacterium]
MKKALALATAACALAAAGFAFAGLAANKTVLIKSTAFTPKTVTINGGDTVTWRNADTVNHQVVANNGAFASGQIGPNRIYAKRIDTPGTYNYHDALHPTLKGTVKVTGAPPSVSIGASTPVAVFGNAIHVGGAVSPAAVGDSVTIWAQPAGQASFQQIGMVQTTTNGVYDFTTPPQILTSYKATWKGKTSAIVSVAVQPRLRLQHVGRWFVARAQPGKYGGHWVYVQRANVFGEWVTLKKVTLNSQSAKRFKMRHLPHGLNRLRIFITTNQAGAGYFHGASPSLSFRRR